MDILNRRRDEMHQRLADDIDPDADLCEDGAERKNKPMKKSPKNPPPPPFPVAIQKLFSEE